jgi:hypothetical protein
MRFLRQTLLAVCLISPCILVVGQPNAVDDVANGNEDTDIIINILGNDEDGGSAIAPGTVDLDPVMGGPNPEVTVTEGTFLVDALGVVTFTPIQDFAGDVTEIFYTVADEANNVSDPASINVTVDAVNDAPTVTTIAPQTIDEDDATNALDFTISDVDSDPSSFTVDGS